MSIGSDDFKKLLGDAEKITLDQYDSRISSLTRLNDSEINSLFPKKEDKDNLVKLMKIVKSAASDIDKTQQLIDNISGIAGTVIKLLGKLTWVLIL